MTTAIQTSGSGTSVSALQAIQQSGTATASSSSSTSTDGLDKDAFLKIFLTQMQNQDPLNPMDATDFTSQLAQFSSLEQLYNVNTNLQSLETSSGDSARYQAMDFCGKEVTAKGDQLSLGQDGSANGGFQLQGQADCTVQVTDSAGNMVRTIPLGTLSAGQQTFSWDGLDASGNRVASGSYNFSVSATDGTGSSVLADTTVTGTVTRVNLEGSSPILYVGDIPVDLDQVLDISTSSTATGTTTDATTGV
jgi:flagellar basal-body rod modification protein FlgD